MRERGRESEDQHERGEAMKIDAERTNAARKLHQEGVKTLDKWFSYSGNGVSQRIRNKPRTHSKRMRSKRA
jgi:hypothetical protein